MCFIKVCISICFFFNIDESEYCKTLSVTLSNVALKLQKRQQGTYVLSETVNQKPSWMSKDNKTAMWFIPDYQNWAIGRVKNIGSDKRGLASHGNHGNLEPYNVPSDQWDYYHRGSWRKASASDVRIDCTGKLATSL